VPEDELTGTPPPGTTHSAVPADALEILRCGDVEIEGRMPWSSNATFLVRVRAGDRQAQAVYKPGRGERPLWDFPPGLYRREVAAYELAMAMGLSLVPPTVLRDGPLGEGSLQWFIDADFEHHYFSLYEQREDLHDQFRAIAAFDIVANNTDRKAGHCLIGPDDRVYAIDNGLCFAEEFKLRTVIWEFGGEPVPAELTSALTRLAGAVPLAVAALLLDDEVEALRRRAAALAEHAVLPVDPTGRRYPWPLV
jgi:uncharacterized repeat protein (TIGR03843 family)